MGVNLSNIFGVIILILMESQSCASTIIFNFGVNLSNIFVVIHIKQYNFDGKSELCLKNYDEKEITQGFYEIFNLYTDKNKMLYQKKKVTIFINLLRVRAHTHTQKKKILYL